jgi:hypothetical protein
VTSQTLAAILSEEHRLAGLVQNESEKDDIAAPVVFKVMHLFIAKLHPLFLPQLKGVA